MREVIETCRALIPNKEDRVMPPYDLTMNFLGAHCFPQHIDENKGDGPGWYLVILSTAIMPTSVIMMCQVYFQRGCVVSRVDVLRGVSIL
jgi:hypothetical protein